MYKQIQQEYYLIMQIFYVMMIMELTTPQLMEWTYISINNNYKYLFQMHGSHISEAGAIRLAKAMWWMLARIAGWDGGTTQYPVTGITVTGAGGSSVITTDNGTFQLTAAVAPTNATNQTVTWSIVNGTGQATISSQDL